MNAELLNAIMSRYGERHQAKKLNEEAYELTEAIHNYLCGRGSIRAIAEEMADCIVLIEQFRLKYGITEEELEAIADAKITRQIERMKTETR